MAAEGVFNFIWGGYDLWGTSWGKDGFRYFDNNGGGVSVAFPHKPVVFFVRGRHLVQAGNGRRDGPPLEICQIDELLRAKKMAGRPCLCPSIGMAWAG